MRKTSRKTRVAGRGADRRNKAGQNAGGCAENEPEDPGGCDAEKRVWNRARKSRRTGPDNAVEIRPGGRKQNCDKRITGGCCQKRKVRCGEQPFSVREACLTCINMIFCPEQKKTKKRKK